jgi:cellulose synthase operon protein C
MGCDRYWLLLLAALLPADRSPCRADERQFAVAAAHYSAQRWDLAEAEFRGYLESSADAVRTADARYFLAECQVQRGELGAARNDLDRFLADFPEHALSDRARFRRGEIAYLQGDRPQAARDLPAFLERQPEDAWSLFAWIYLADLALTANEAQQATDLYRRALERAADDVQRAECQLGLGQALDALGQESQALDAYRAAATVRAPAGYEARLRLAMGQIRLSQYAEALTALEGLAQVHPSAAAWIYYWQGKALEASDRGGEAADVWQQAAAAHAAHELAPRLLYEAGRARHRQGQIEAARQNWEHVLAQWPNDAWAESSAESLVELELAAKNWDAAREQFVQFCRRFPDSHARDALSARLAAQLLAHQQADVLSDALAGEHELAPSKGDQGFYLALAHLQAGRYPQALQTLQQIPDDASPVSTPKRLAARVAAHIGLQQFSEAAVDAAAYLQHYGDQPDAPACRTQLVLALANLGKLDEALGELETLRSSHDGETERGLTQSLELLVAQKLHQAGRYAESANHFSRIRDQSSGELQDKAWRGLAWTRYHDEQFEAVLEACLGYLSRPAPPDRDEMLWLQARALQQLARGPEALAVYQQLYDQQPAGPFADDALLAAARWLDQAEDEASAAALYTRWLHDFPDRPETDQVLYLQAWALTDGGRATEAQPVFRELYENHRGSRYWPDAAYRLAELARQSGQADQSQRLLDELLPQAAGTAVAAHARLLQGRLAADQRRWSDVVAILRELRNDGPPPAIDESAAFWIGEALFHLGQWRAADEQFAELASNDSRADADWTATVALRRAQIEAHEQDWREALESIAALEQRFPHFAQQHEADYVAGRALLGLARIDEARARWQRVVDHPAARGSETAAMAQWMIGESYLHQQKLDEALRAYYRVDLQYSIPQWRAAALLQIGKCRESQGKREAAAKAYAQAAERDPESTFAEQARRRLAALEESGT